MTSTFTSNLTLEKPGPGEQSNSWGNTINSNLDAIDAAIGLRYTGDPNNAAELRAWWDSLPSGAVAVNTGWLRDGSGSFLDDYYVVKDWQGD